VDAEQWRPFLKRWSEEWIAAHDPENDQPLDEGVVRDGWLGFAPATEEEITAAEARLGVSFPPSLREFLAVTNGWRDAGGFIYRLAGPAELGWLRDMDSFWIDSIGAAFDTARDEDEPDDESATALLRRALQLSTDGDCAVMFLDPRDVNAEGEWAGYWLASWSGEGPERFGSFYDLMYGQYKSFHALNHPPGQTRDQWDAKIEQARLDALGGEVDGPLAVLEEAEEFGRERAGLLRFQMLTMLGHWHGCRRVVTRCTPRTAKPGGAIRCSRPRSCRCCSPRTGCRAALMACQHWNI
jgi:SMI1 / KNR4 family (SUKH-1)